MNPTKTAKSMSLGIGSFLRKFPLFTPKSMILGYLIVNEKHD